MSKDTQNRVLPSVRKVPEVRFNLKSYEKGNKEVLIFSIFRYNVEPTSEKDNGRRRLRYTTTKRVNPKYWNKKTNRCKESVDYPDGSKINKSLEALRAVIREYYEYEAINLNLEPSDFKIELDYRLGRKKRPEVKAPNYSDLTQFLESQIQKHKIGKEHLRGGQKYKKLQTLKNRLKKYSKVIGIDPINYEHINEAFKDSFILWMEKKELSQNTISKEIELLKGLLRDSRKYHDNDYYTDDGFRVQRKQIPKPCPTLKELRHLMKFEFESERRQKAIDLYLIGAFTGLRWSDVIRLTKKNLIIDDEGNESLEVYTYKGRNVKSDNEVIIPILPDFKKLIRKYNWDFPKMSDTECNRTLKEAAKEAELNREVLINSAVKGEEATKYPLHEVISFHSSRRAFITFMINDLEVSAEELKLITGQSLQVLLSYWNGDKKKNASKVSAKINKKLKGLHVANKKQVG